MCMILARGLIVYLTTTTSRATVAYSGSHGICDHGLEGEGAMSMITDGKVGCAVPSVELAGASCLTSCDGLFLEP